MQVNVAGIMPESIVDGPGFRYAVFVQGCPHGCPGCHNPETHSFEGGTPMALEELFQQFQRNPMLKGITLSGGEPFCQAEALARLAEMVHGAGKDVVTYTGYTFEELSVSQGSHITALLRETDLLVDGPYLEAQRNIDLLFRGSENQRLIDVKRSLAAGRAVLWEQQ